MTYSTPEEVRELLQGFVSEPGNEYDVTPDKLSDSQIEYEIMNADAQIDLVLRKRGYSTPLPGPVPDIIHTISRDIATAQCDLIFRGSRDYQGAGDANPFRVRYDRARRLLLQIGDGDYPIYNPGEGPETVAPYDAGVFNPYPGDVLRTEHIFPRGADFLLGSGEYGERETLTTESWPGGDYYGRG